MYYHENTEGYRFRISDLGFRAHTTEIPNPKSQIDTPQYFYDNLFI